MNTIVSKQAWLESRKEFLIKEKEFTKTRDELSRQRRQLPMVKIDKDYEFENEKGRVKLSDLFADSSQLIVYHFMLGPGWKAGCPSCSYIADNFQGISSHLKARDISFAAISRAPFSEIEKYRKRMDWKFAWHSSFESDFNFDFEVSFTEKELEEGTGTYNYSKMKFPSQEAPGASVFYKNADGEIFHTYSTFGRGLDMLIGSYHFIDMTPLGRNEQDLPLPMAWVKRHDEYEH